jgi:hypothetical protein
LRGCRLRLASGLSNHLWYARSRWRGFAEGHPLAFKSSRPIYAIILLALSVIFVCATFLPFLYSLLLPDEDIERVVAALKGSGPAPLDADSVVDEAKAAAGPLIKAIPIGCSYGGSIGFHLSGSHEQTRVSQTAYIYVAWFQKHPGPMLVAITLYANDAGQRVYGIGEIDAASVARQYAIPVLLLGVSLFLVRKRKSPDQAS